MNPSIIEKKSWEELTVTINASPALSQGNNVSSVTATVYDSSSVDVTATMLPDGVTVSGNKISGQIKAGTSGSRYFLQTRGTCDNGDKIEDDLIIVVQDFSL